MPPNETLKVSNSVGSSSPFLFFFPTCRLSSIQPSTSTTTASSAQATTKKTTMPVSDTVLTQILNELEALKVSQQDLQTKASLHSNVHHLSQRSCNICPGHCTPLLLAPQLIKYVSFFNSHLRSTVQLPPGDILSFECTKPYTPQPIHAHPAR